VVEVEIAADPAAWTADTSRKVELNVIQALVG
jgi:hypothetical protein